MAVVVDQAGHPGSIQKALIGFSQISGFFPAAFQPDSNLRSLQYVAIFWLGQLFVAKFASSHDIFRSTGSPALASKALRRYLIQQVPAVLSDPENIRVRSWRIKHPHRRKMHKADYPQGNPARNLRRNIMDRVSLRLPSVQAPSAGLNCGRMQQLIWVPTTAGCS